MGEEYGKGVQFARRETHTAGIHEGPGERRAIRTACIIGEHRRGIGRGPGTVADEADL